MFKTLLIGFILAVNCQAFAGMSKFLTQKKSLNDQLASAFDTFYFQTIDLSLRVSNDEKTYLEEYERDNLVSETMTFLREIRKIDDLIIKYQKDSLSKNAAKILVLKGLRNEWLAKFVRTTFMGGNAVVAALSEDSSRFSYSGQIYKNIITQLELETETSVLSSQVTMYYIYRNFKSVTEKFKLNNEEYDSLFFSVANFIDNMAEVHKMMNEIDLKAGTYSAFYFLKVFFLKAASYVALPGNHKISLETLKKVDSKLLPGDIGIIQRYYKLSNLVFKGNWTHSLLYIGTYSKLKTLTKNDRETNDYYVSKCFKEELNCYDFISFLEVKYPNALKKYKDGEKLSDPIVTIEALKPGVILFNMKQSMGWDNLAVLRPTKLSFLDRVKAIEYAFENIGKPYDYNFNGQTIDRFVCTELVSYAYQNDPRINKKGLSWEMNFVMNKPVMYAFDILETYFKRKNTNKQELKVVLYLKGEKGEYGQARNGSESELLDTVDLND